eukprot:TRINITY_DN3125_c0_g1_i2.p1 TRINITY_DN3125_c0_g1~~TRINITY_DN3125_c0_g1_i2.p1  ORF type:complete len:668 (+),score=153.02 TRINITY_DN3125_c0_g1_i2:344-2347(+)
MSQNTNDPNYPVLKGILYKQGAKGIVRGWKKRWFSLKNNTQIHYYKSAEELQSLGYIDANAITSIRETPNTGLRRDRGEYLFEVHTPNRVYHLLANNENLMKYWIQGLSLLVQLVKAPPNQRAALTGANQTVVQPPIQAPLEKPTLSQGRGVTQALISAEMKEMSLAEQENLSKNNIQLAVAILSLSPPMQSKEHYVYCVLALDKQQVRTKPVKDSLWNETFSFDISDPKSELVIMVWLQEDEAGKLLGEASIPVNTLQHDVPKEQTFKLNIKGQPANHDIILSTQYSSAPGKRVGIEDFDLLKVIGKGNFGKVMQVRKKDTSRIYAMKVLKKGAILAADAVKHTLSETNVLRRIKHPFIVSLKYAFQTEDKLYMIMDYLNGGELFFHLSNVDRFSDERSRFYAAEIVLALGYLHAKHVVYRDLKPENLLLDMDGHVCLTDFGLVKENLGYGDVTHTFCGSPEYLAPEILLGKGYGRAVDWWALGTFIYEMLEGLPPFYDEDVGEMNRKILRQPLYFDAAHFTPEAMSLLEGLLQRDPEKRLGSGPTDYLEITSHPFFKDINWEDLYNKKVEPSFKPHLLNPTDVRYFDPEFTNQVPRHSVTNDKLSKSSQRAFDGFSYVSPSLEQAIAAKRKSVRATRQTFGSPHHNLSPDPNTTIYTVDLGECKQ